MEQKSVYQVTVIVLRLIGVLTMFIGLVFATQTIIELIALACVKSGLDARMPAKMNVSLTGTASTLGIWSIVYQIATIVWGRILYVSARSIARRITDESAAPEQAG